MRKERFLLLSIICLILSIILSSFTGIFINKSHYVKSVENTLQQKIEKMHSYLLRFEKGENAQAPKIIKALNKDDLILLKYVSDSLVFWSSNSIPVNNTLEEETFKKPVIKLSNSFYFTEIFNRDSVVYIGLINLLNHYPYENDLLPSGFNSSFNLPDGTDLELDPEKGFAVHGKDGEYWFSIDIPLGNSSSPTQRIIATLFLFLGLILLGYYFYFLIQGCSNPVIRSRLILGIILLLIIIRFIQLKLALGFEGYILFDPFIYAESELVPSLGDLLLNSLIVFFIAILIYRFVDFSLLLKKDNRVLQVLLLIAYTIGILIFFFYAHYFNYSLIFNSWLSFSPNEIDRISVYSLISILIIGLNYLAAGLIFIRIVNSINIQLEYRIPLLVFILTSAFVFSVLILFFDYPGDILSMVFFYLITLLIGTLIYRNADISSYSIQVLLVLIFSIYSLSYFLIEGNEKESKVKTSLALSLANEHDPVAEYLFEELSGDIESDTSLIGRLKRDSINIDELGDYLTKNYFTGFWSKYHLRITLCRPTDNVLIEVPEFQWVHCYSFFDTLSRDIGFNLPESNFYYLDYQAGRISYLGRFPFLFDEPPYEITLFIELDSRLTRNLLGYPELLLDKELQKERLIKKYSYAKYYKGNLVMQAGDFSYSLSSELFGSVDNELQNIKLDGYNHLLYKPEKDNLIVLSLPSIKFIDVIVGFSYIFLFYYVCLMLVITAQRMQRTDFHLLDNLRSKIQFTIISILIVSLMLVAAGTIWLNIRSYRNNQNNILQEKIHSVLIELKHKLEYEVVLSPYWSAPNYDNLDQLLIKFSDVFYSDINLYDPQGELLATSRYEIFDLGLQGEKMDPTAYHKLQREKRAQFIHREKIGELSYLSAYTPFENTEGKLLAYLNLPYFTKQKEFQASLSALIVTIINIYVILILITIVTSVLISDQITRPLEILQQRFRQLKLGDKYEQITYKRKDEIGRLVEEYNKMVRELEKSVDLLARSERESAWREMAKQIAHEIKNPLTPMRLSVQQLKKLWLDKKEDFDKYMDSVSGTLIEQIDNLSAIASEFSSFAKMPEIKLEPIDIVDVTKKCVKLFEGSNDYSITFNAAYDKLIIHSDREQLSRVLINVIKNGIQSIPDDRKGIIAIELDKKVKEVEIRISDNGRGIPDEVKSRMFMPNFTTKSSGMGLGLAIVKNIVEQLKGKITFNTKLGEGTVFILSFPV